MHVTELFSPGVTGGALRANIDWKSVFLKGVNVGQFQPNFHVVRDVPREPFLQGMPYNFVADSIHTKKLCSKLFSNEVHFLTENGHFAFLSPL